MTSQKEIELNIPRMKIKGLQPRLLYPGRLSFKMEGKIRSFLDQKKAKRVHLQIIIARDAEGTALRRCRKIKEREEHRYKGGKWE